MGMAACWRAFLLASGALLVCTLLACVNDGLCVFHVLQAVGLDRNVHIAAAASRTVRRP